jgi:hypothetical protein
MTVDDFDEFSRALGTAGALVRRRLSPDIAAAYFTALKDLALDPLLDALGRFTRTAEARTPFPTPVELRRHVEGRVPPRPRRGLATLSAPEGPPVTRAGLAAILREVAPRAAPRLRQAWQQLAEELERGARVAAGTLDTSGPLGAVIARQLGRARAPGEEG